jgi:hypothetical protein
MSSRKAALHWINPHIRFRRPSSLPKMLLGGWVANLNTHLQTTFEVVFSSSGFYTDKKENQLFLKFKKIPSGAVE